MVFIPRDVLFGGAPVPAFVSPSQVAIARAVANSLAQQMRANPSPFVTGNPALERLYDQSPTARELWESFFGEPITYPQDGPSGSVGQEGRTYYFGFTYTAPGITGAPPLSASWNLFDGMPGTSGGVEGPLTEIGRVEKTGTFPFERWEISVNHKNGRTAPVGINANIYGRPSVTSFKVIDGTIPSALVPTSPFPSTPPSFPTPLVDVPPFMVPIPAVPPGIPFPTEVPVFVPRPGNLPNAPVPVLPGRPNEPDRAPFVPPMWIVPGGVEIGPPGPGSIIVIPPGIPATVPSTNTQEENERVPPRPAICVEPPEPPGDCCDCESIREIVVEELDNKFPPKRPNEVDTIEYGSANSRSIELPQFCEYVRLIITDAPENRKEQNGGSSAPSVYYNGWCSFGSLGSSGERLPVNYDDCTFFPPSGARFYSYTLYHGTTATLQVRYRREV